MDFPFFKNTRKASEIKKEKEKLEQLKNDIRAVSNLNDKKAVYKYFNGEAIIDSLSMSADTAKKAGELIKTSSIKLLSVKDKIRDYYSTSFYDDESDFGKVYGEVTAEVSSKDRFIVYIEFDKNKLRMTRCNCSKCYNKNRIHAFLSSDRENCEHVVATVFLLNAYLEIHELGDETNYFGNSFLSNFEDEDDYEAEKVRIVPKLIFDKKSLGNERLYLQFKIGRKKLLMIKKYRDFINSLNEGEIYHLGKNDEVKLNISCFDEESKKYLKFIEDLVAEEKTISCKYADYSKTRLNTSRIEIDNVNVDKIYELLKDQKPDFIIESLKGTETKAVELRDYNEKPVVTIKSVYDRNIFAGINIDINFPTCIISNNYAYCYKNNYINRCDVNILNILKPLNKMDINSNIVIGRKNIGKFYSSVMPLLREYAIVKDKAPEALQYIPKKGEITYYLDIENEVATGRVEVNYNGGKVDIISGKVLERNGNDLLRNLKQEKKSLEVLKRFMRGTDIQGALATESEDDIYILKTEGIDVLNKFGKVLGSENFNNVRIYKNPSTSIGVSVQSNLLKLEFLSEDITPEELADIVTNYRKKKKYYRLKSGAFINMDTEEMKDLNEMLNVLGISSKDLRAGALSVPLYRSIYINEMMESHNDLVKKRDESFGELIQKFDKIHLTDFRVPAEVENTLRGYQKEGFRWLRTVEELGFGGILADDMGLGKTLQIISLLIDAKKCGRLTKVLIVCPASLVYNWSEEISKFDKGNYLSACVLASSKDERQESLIEDNADIYISSYDTLRRDIAMYHEKRFSHQIIDEAQFIKNQTTGVAKAVKAIDAQVKFALTGTPIENRLSELWSIFDYIMPGFLYNYTSFRNKYESLIVKKGNEDIAKLLSRMISPFVLRRLKSEVAVDLPEKTEEIRVSRFEKKQQLSYDTELAKLKKVLDGGEEYNSSKLQILAHITRLRQICCDPGLLFENYSGESAKLETCIDLVKSGIESGHKILLFSQFTSMLEIIESRFKTEKISYYVITGTTSKDKRLELVNKFNEDGTNVFLISLKAGGTGLNLVGADIVIHYDPWWNFAAQNQATDRAHRIGQKNMVTVYRLIAKGTIEEKIVRLQESKRDLADKVLNFEEGVSLSTISKEELIEILG